MPYSGWLIIFLFLCKCLCVCVCLSVCLSVCVCVCVIQLVTPMDCSRENVTLPAHPNMAKCYELLMWLLYCQPRLVQVKHDIMNNVTAICYISSECFLQAAPRYKQEKPLWYDCAKENRQLKSILIISGLLLYSKPAHCVVLMCYFICMYLVYGLYYSYDC